MLKLETNRQQTNKLPLTQQAERAAVENSAQIDAPRDWEISLTGADQTTRQTQAWIVVRVTDICHLSVAVVVIVDIRKAVFTTTTLL